MVSELSLNFTYIYAIGAAQGLILAIALWHKSVNQRSNKVLSVWMLFLVLDLFMKVIYLNDSQTPLLPGYTLVAFSLSYMAVSFTCTSKVSR